MISPHKLLLASLLSWLPLSSVLTSNALAAEHDHLSLEKTDSLSLQAMHEAAMLRVPDSLMDQAYREQAEGYTALGSRLLADSPSWEASYASDALSDDTGFREMGAGITLPLWRPGERSDARQLGETHSQRAAAWEAQLSLTVAGRLRTVLGQIHQAETALALANESIALAEQVLDISQRLHAAGSIAEYDLLQAESLLLQRRSEALLANAELVDAERGYNVLTGLEQRSASPLAESRSPLQEIPDEHPSLRYLQSLMALEDARIEEKRRQSRGSPSITLGTRRERGNFIDPYVDIAAVSVSIPFGTSAAMNTAVADARSSRLVAEVQWRNTRLELERQLHEVMHDTEVVEESLEYSQAQLALNERFWQMSVTAFEAGETTLTEVKLALQRLADSRYETERLRLEQQLLDSEYNQIVGVLP